MRFYKLIWLILAIPWGCGALDAPERALEVRRYEGTIYRTALTDDEITNQGGILVYRFRSVPNMVYVKKQKKSEQLVPILQFDEKTDSEFRNENNLNFRESIVSPAILPLQSRDVINLSPYEESGFLRGISKIKADNLQFLPVKIAIIDSGIVPSTPSIADALKKMTNLTYDFEQKKWQSHATAISSVYSGAYLNGKKINIYAPNAELQGYKISFSGDDPTLLRRDLGMLQLAVALDNAVADGARIVNLSFSYQEEIPDEIARIEKLIMQRASGVVFLAAAGNSNEKIDDKNIYPAAYHLPNLVIVGNHDRHLAKAPSSNYGQSVDISAPGVNLPLNTASGEMSYFTGTSFSVPVVGSALALYWGLKPQAGIKTVLKDLFETSTPKYSEVSLERFTRFGRLNTLDFVERAIAQ